MRPTANSSTWTFKLRNVEKNLLWLLRFWWVVVFNCFDTVLYSGIRFFMNIWHCVFSLLHNTSQMVAETVSIDSSDWPHYHRDSSRKHLTNFIIRRAFLILLTDLIIRRAFLVILTSPSDGLSSLFWPHHQMGFPRYSDLTIRRAFRIILTSPSNGLSSLFWPRHQTGFPNYSDLTIRHRFPHYSDLTIRHRFPHYSDLTIRHMLPHYSDLTIRLRLPHKNIWIHVVVSSSSSKSLL